MRTHCLAIVLRVIVFWSVCLSSVSIILRHVGAVHKVIANNSPMCPSEPHPQRPRGS